MDNKNESSPTKAETAALNLLAVLTGLVVSAICCNVLLNLIEYHSFTAPSPLPEGDNLGEMFLLPLILLFALFVFPVSTLGFMKLFDKLQ